MSNVSTHVKTSAIMTAIAVLIVSMFIKPVILQALFVGFLVLTFSAAGIFIAVCLYQTVYEAVAEFEKNRAKKRKSIPAPKKSAPDMKTDKRLEPLCD